MEPPAGDQFRGGRVGFTRGGHQGLESTALYDCNFEFFSAHVKSITDMQ
jgi:hypothetical protein